MQAHTTHMCNCMHMHLYACAHVCGSQRIILGVIFRNSCLSPSWSRVYQSLDWLPHKPQGSTFLFLPSARIINICHHTWHLYIGSEDSNSGPHVSEANFHWLSHLHSIEVPSPPSGTIGCDKSLLMGLWGTRINHSRCLGQKPHLNCLKLSEELIDKKIELGVQMNAEAQSTSPMVYIHSWPIWSYLQSGSAL